MDIDHFECFIIFVHCLHTLSTMLQTFFTDALKNDAILLGVLLMILGGVFYTAHSPSKFWKTFYRFVPTLLLCYFLPSLLNWPLGIIDPKESNLYFVASRYLLPACLILLCLSIDIKGIMNLGSKALIMFFTASFGIVIGGPVAILVVKWIAPSLLSVEMDALWKGLSTVAGSWIGGGANQAAMKEIFQVGDNLFGTMLVIDIIVANIWLGFLLYGIKISDKINRYLKADNSSIEALKKKMISYQESVKEIPSLHKMFILLGIAFGGTAIAHLFSTQIVSFLSPFEETIKSFRLDSLLSGFFWLVVISTTLGVGLSFTKMRKLEGIGASRWGSIFIYILVATIGMKMNLGEIFENKGLLAIGLIWMLIHVGLLFLVAKIIRAPYFFVAVGSQANVGGAASAPVVAAAFHPSLASVGILMAVLGYALGTYGAIICAQMMRYVAT